MLISVTLQWLHGRLSRIAQRYDRYVCTMFALLALLCTVYAYAPEHNAWGPG